MNSIILDTNSYSFFTSKDTKIKKEIQKADIVYLPLIVIGELYSGFYRGNKFENNESELKSFLSDKKVRILGLTKITSKIYGKILHDLVMNGTPITANDVWIAASAIETNSTLITYDKHFLNISTPKGIGNLKLWDRIK